MADHAVDDVVFDGGIFIYRGGRAPQHITHARIDESLDEIEDEAFKDCEHLLMVDTHDGIRRVGKSAFYKCKSLRRINLKSAGEIDEYAFYFCENLESVDFGDRLETIGQSAFRFCERLVQVDTHIRRVGKYAFQYCKSLRRINLKSAIKIEEWGFNNCESLESVQFDELEIIGDYAFYECSSLTHLKLPSIITIGHRAFCKCKRLTDIELSDRLETIGLQAFANCQLRLQRIAVPLKRDLFVFNDTNQKYNQFDDCYFLATVDLVGGIDTTIASLHMESWRTEVNDEINRINQVLPNILAPEKTDEIQRWMDSVIEKFEHYKSEHNRYVKEGITLLELALWKAKLGEKEDKCVEGRAKKAKVDAESARQDKRMTCGADMVINNVLPFLHLE